MQSVRFAGYKIRVPGHPILRLALGLLLVVCGVFGFLPVLGFWMIPLGLIILSIDIAAVRRKRRAWSVRLGVWLTKRWPNVAKALGFGRLRDSKLD